MAGSVHEDEFTLVTSIRSIQVNSEDELALAIVDGEVVAGKNREALRTVRWVSSSYVNPFSTTTPPFIFLQSLRVAIVINNSRVANDTDDSFNCVIF